MLSHIFTMTPLFFVTAFATIFLIALLKGMFGGGFALVGIPVLSNFIAPITAAAIISPLVCLMDLCAIVAYPPRTWNVAILKILIPAAVGGMICGALVLDKAPSNVIGLGIGLISIVFSIQWFRRALQSSTTPAPASSRRYSGWLWGALSGFTSLIAHAGGPPAAIYLLPKNLPKTELAGTQTIFFMVGNWVKLIPYLLLGQLDAHAWTIVLALSPAVPTGVGLGRLLHGRLDQKKIYFLCYAIVLVAGANMVWDALPLRGAFN